MPKRSIKKLDTYQTASAVIRSLTGAAPETAKNPAAVALGRLGGLKGGAARAKSLTAERRKEIALLAAKKRWHKTTI
jgi:hypothetical protein